MTRLVAAFLLCCLTNPGHAQEPKPGPKPTSEAVVAGHEHEEIAEGNRISPADLAASLQQSASPLILQVGPRTMFDQAHILGAEYGGAASTEAGLRVLRERLATVAKDRWIVLYCGCCPWDRCPNIRPALRQVQAMGFTHVQALYLPDHFGTDWVDKGYPIEK